MANNIYPIYEKVKSNIQKVIVGKSGVIDLMLISLFCRGHMLVEDVPGTGKTLLVKSLAASVDCDSKRVQFTPDLLPSDITGINFFNMKTSEFEFVRGPIFSNLVIADEINRATPKTQSALLEAMQEHTVTAGGQTYSLEEPFFVLATQNPIEQDGTYPLPEAQMDRFMFKLTMTFPTVDELGAIVNMTQASMAEQAAAVLTGEDLLTMRATAKEIPITQEVFHYAMRLVAATHPELSDSPEFTKQYIRFGASPRAGQALITAAKVRALMAGRFNVSYEDINVLAYPVLRHRIKPSFTAITEKRTVDQLIEGLLAALNGKKTAPAEPTAPAKGLFRK